MHVCIYMFTYTIIVYKPHTVFLYQYLYTHHRLLLMDPYFIWPRLCIFSQDTVVNTLLQKNYYDLMLWNFAKVLISQRIVELKNLIADEVELSKLNTNKFYCKNRTNYNVKYFRRPVKSTFGIFRHPGHKGPVARELTPQKQV